MKCNFCLKRNFCLVPCVCFTWTAGKPRLAAHLFPVALCATFTISKNNKQGW